MDKIETKIKEWLSKSGYPLELRTEKLLRGHGFAVFNSEPYEDSDTKIKREIDLLAEKSVRNTEVEVSVHLIVECKKSSNPFILLESSEHPFNTFSLFTNYYMGHSMCHPALFGPQNFHIKQSKNHSAGFKIVQGFSTSDETLFKAGFALSKAFYFHLENEQTYIDEYIADQVHTVHIPLLVIDAPFYSASLDDSLNIKVRRIDSAVWRSHQITETSEDFSIVVVTIDNLETVAKEIMDAAKLYLEFLTKNKPYRLKKREKPLRSKRNIVRKGKEKGK